MWTDGLQPRSYRQPEDVCLGRLFYYGALRSKGWALKHVMNITDIDDKIIKRSIETGQDIETYTEPYTLAFFEDCQPLHIQRPDIITPRRITYLR